MTVSARLIADYQAQAIWRLCGELGEPCPPLAHLDQAGLGDLIIELRDELKGRDDARQAS